MPKGRPSARSASSSVPRAARRGRRPSQSAQVSEIVTRYVNDLVTAISQEFRRDIADEVRSFIASNGAGTAALVASTGRRGPARRKRLVKCIAPGCSNPSKGPRFHYLCEKHRDAPKKEYEAWRLKAKESKQAA
jgi:hypothetical protein